MRISKAYDIEIGFHIYQVEGSGDYFSSEIFTSYNSGIVTGGDNYLVPGLDKQLAGGYHTHGGNGSDRFSSRDIRGRISGDVAYASRIAF